MSLGQFLEWAGSADAETRKRGEQELRQFSDNNLAGYVVGLVQELANEARPAQVRQLAGVELKNNFVGRSEERSQELEQKWISLDPNARTAVKQQVVEVFGSQNKEARTTAALVCSTIACIELPRGLWNDLLDNLVKGAAASNPNEFQRAAIFACLGYIFEGYSGDLIKASINDILTRLVEGLQPSTPNIEIRKFAIDALNHCLPFIGGNMEREDERNYLMRVLCDCTQLASAPDPDLRAKALDCLGSIAANYYAKLGAYMQALWGITSTAVQTDVEVVAMTGIEFWSTLCDVEMELKEEGKTCENYVLAALPQLLELIKSCLIKQDENADEDEWNLATAAGTCLELVAQCAGDAVLSLLESFFGNMSNPTDWRQREAAMLAFGAVMEGSEGRVEQYMDTALPILLKNTEDGNLLVRDTAIWTLGRIAEFYPSAIIDKCLEQVLKAFVTRMADDERVAIHACWALGNLCKFWEDAQMEEGDAKTYALSRYFAKLVEELLQAIDRRDEPVFRQDASECLISLLLSAAQDCNETISKLVPEVVRRIKLTFANMGSGSAEDRGVNTTMQGLLCGALQSMTRKLGPAIRPHAPAVMEVLLMVFKLDSSTAHEESLMAVGAVANAVGADFETFMPHFAPFLFRALASFEEYSVCNLAVGCVTDIVGALGRAAAPYCNNIVEELLKGLHAKHLNRDVKPAIISCLGDVALNIGPHFDQYLEPVLVVLVQAAETAKQVPSNNEELTEYRNQLCESICEAYTGIIHGLPAESLQKFMQHGAQVLHFIQSVAKNMEDVDDLVLKGCVGVVGDLAKVCGQTVKAALLQEFVHELLVKASQSEDEEVRKQADWARLQLGSM